MDPVEAIFGNLDRWRNLPAYQLERRADVFFSVYLKDIVEEFTGVTLEPEILPELPIKRDLIWADRSTNQSVKVDYVLFAKDRSRVFFVELKTDPGSRRDVQDEYLETAKRVGFRRIVEGVRAIIMASKARQKYHHLAAALARLGYLSLPTDLPHFMSAAPPPGWRERLAAIAVTEFPDDIEVIYVQPNATDRACCIDFARFAEFVARSSDAFSQAFAKHLLIWRAAAGSRGVGII